MGATYKGVQTGIFEKYKEEKFQNEIRRVCDLPTIEYAAKELYAKENHIAELIRNKNVREIEEKVYV